MEKDFKGLLDLVKQKEKRTKYRTIIFTFIPVVLAFVLLFYTSFQVKRKNDQIKRLEKTRVNIKTFIDSIRSDSTTRYATGLYVNIMSCDTVWNNRQLIKRDSIKISTGKSAYDSINKIKSNGSVSFNRISIRYYPKKGDKDLLLQSLALSGFKWIFINKKNYESDLLSNVIHYSNDVDPNAIKLAALSFLRTGFDVKIIEPYSAKYLMKKKNSIEIASYKSAESLPAISLDSICRFRKNY